MTYKAKYKHGEMIFEKGNNDKAYDYAESYEFYNSDLLILENLTTNEMLIDYR